MVRVSKLKSKQAKKAASADDIAKTLVTRATAWATAASHAEDAAMAVYETEKSISNSCSFNLERFIASAKAVDAAQAASIAAAKVLANAMAKFGGTSID